MIITNNCILTDEMILNELPFPAAIAVNYKVKFRNVICKELNTYVRKNSKYDFCSKYRRNIDLIAENRAWIVTLGNFPCCNNVLAYKNNGKLYLFNIEKCNRLKHFEISVTNERYEVLMGFVISKFLNGIHTLPMLFKSIGEDPVMLPFESSMKIDRYVDFLKYVCALTHGDPPVFSYENGANDEMLSSKDLLYTLGYVLTTIRDIDTPSVCFEKRMDEIDVFINGVCHLTFNITKAPELAQGPMWVRQSDYLLGIIFAILSELLLYSSDKIQKAKRKSNKTVLN